MALHKGQRASVLDVAAAVAVNEKLSDRLARAEALLREWRQAGYLETKNADAHDHHICDELVAVSQATDAFLSEKGGEDDPARP